MHKIDPLDCPILNAINRSSPLQVVDVGAAGGIDPVWHDYCLNGNGHAFGFEPFPSSFEKLTSSENICYFPWAISDQVGEAEFFGLTGVGSLSRRLDRERRFGESYEKIQVKTETLENLRQTDVISKIDVLKIDVEGHEMDVLRGAGNFLNEVLYMKAEFTFERSKGNSFADIDSIMAAHGMKLFDFSTNYTHYRSLRGGDVLYMRDVSKLAKSGRKKEELKESILKLVIISIINNNFQYAYFICHVAAQAKIITAEEFTELEKFCTAMIYKPELIRNFPGEAQLCWFIFNTSLLFGGHGRSKSIPRDNRLQKSLRMWTGNKLLLRLFRDKIQQYWQQIGDRAR